MKYLLIFDSEKFKWNNELSFVNFWLILEDGGERLAGEKSLVASVAASGVPSYLLDVPQVSEKF